jgi:diguanylate cyclase (GGDEF)-like protein
VSILIVDDSPDTCWSLQALLTGAGHDDIRTATSGAAALDLLSQLEDQVDLVLLDVVMPRMDGLEVCRRIKARPAWRDIPVLMMTGRNDEECLERAFAGGAIDYLVKPIQFVELTARVRSALTLKRELDLRRSRERELLRVTELLKDANQALERLARLDALTGLANRRHLTEHLDQEWRRCRRSEEWLSVLMVDVDHFKAYNDFYGHQHGDECLQRIAKVLESAVKRSGDLVARYGGEEFVLVLPNMDVSDVKRLAAMLQAELEALAIPHESSTAARHVTISCGGAGTIPHPPDQPRDLLARADQALYQAKTAGRNRACFAPPQPQSASSRTESPETQSAGTAE